MKIKKRVAVSNRGITHYQAICLNCDFNEADHIDTAALRALIYKHVRKTGHDVSVEKTVSTLYMLREQK